MHDLSRATKYGALQTSSELELQMSNVLFNCSIISKAVATVREYTGIHARDTGHVREYTHGTRDTYGNTRTFLMPSAKGSLNNLQLFRLKVRPPMTNIRRLAAEKNPIFSQEKKINKECDNSF